jgi:hypothetical protein
MDESKSADTSELISSFGSPTNFLNNSNNRLSSIMDSRRQSLNKLEAQKKKRRSSISILNEMMMTEIKELKDENGKKNESSESKSYSSRSSESENNSSLIKNSKSSAYNSKFNTTMKKATFKSKNTNSENSYSENLGLLVRNKNTILGVNFLTENKATKKKRFDTSMTGSMKLFFGTKIKKEFQNKLRNAKALIKENQDKLSDNIIKAIKDDDINLIQDLMLSDTNKIIYKKILQKETFINMMLINKRMKMLNIILEDHFYKFNSLFPFEYITKKLKLRNKNIFESEELRQFLLNVVESGLYDKGLSKVMGWFLVCFDLKQEFIHFININSDYYPYEQRIYIENDYDLINEYRNNPQNFNEILILCLKNGLEELAIELVHVEGKLENGSVITTAIKFKNKDFLKYVWEEPIISFKRHHLKNRRIFNLNQDKNKDNDSKLCFNKGMKVFNISSLIDQKKKKNFLSKNLITDIISTWKFLDQDNELFNSLFKSDLYDEMNILIYRFPNHKNWRFTKLYFKTIIKNKVINLILPCLKDDKCKEVLKEKDIQQFIVNNYLTVGNLLYYGAEMINNIPTAYLDYSLSNIFIDNIILALKNRVITNCHSPVLTCLIIYEIISNIKQISINFGLKCKKVSNKLMTICKNIDESTSDEKYIKYLLSQKDSKGRNGYEIAAYIPGCPILESNKIGNIVDNMWQGHLRYEGIFDFNILLRFIKSPKSKDSNPFNAFNAPEMHKTYFHQICLWKSSCALRFIQESLTTILLIIIYNLFLFYIVNYDEIMSNFNELTKRDKWLLIIYIIWCCIIVLNIPLNIIYCKLSKKRKFSFDFWNCIEIAMMICSFLTLVDTQKLFGKYDEYGNLIPSNKINDAAFLIRVIILSANDFLVWLRITGILLTYNEFGSLIRMIYLLSIIVAKYLVIYLIIIVASATIYTTLFYKASIMYDSYSKTFTTLFQGYLQNSKYQYFSYYKKFGAILCIIFVIFGGIILVNMLIILLSNEYEKLSASVVVSHKSTLIKYYKRYKWDKKYGYIMFLATPFNIINYLIIPLHLFFEKKNKNKSIKNSLKNINIENTNSESDITKTLTTDENFDLKDIIEKNKNEKIEDINNQNDKKEDIFNSTVTTIYFLLFYFPYIFIVEALTSLLFIPYAYILGIFRSIKNKNSLRRGFDIFLIFILWIILGIPFIIFNYLLNLFFLCTTIFNNFDKGEMNEKRRIKESITTKEIEKFMQFIHSREHKDKEDLQTLFRNFLLWEHEKSDKMTRRFSNYIKKVTHIGETKAKNINFTLIGLNNKNSKKSSKKNSASFSFVFSSRIYKRNLIIIEILQNFLIDNSYFIVDIEKMKMILPYTMNINNEYIKTLIYTNISNIQKALNKKNKKRNGFIESKTLNKMYGSVIRLNKIFDADYVDPLKDEEERKKNKFDLDENEDNFYSDYFDILTNMTLELKQTILKMEFKTKENEMNIKRNKFL